MLGREINLGELYLRNDMTLNIPHSNFPITVQHVLRLMLYSIEW